MKKKEAVEKEAPKPEIKTTWVAEPISTVTAEQKPDGPKKVTVDLTLEELHLATTGLYVAYQSLDRGELTTWKQKAQMYRSLALKLDGIHEKNNFPKVYSMSLHYAK